MPASSTKKLPANIVAQILLGEGASEGPEGLAFVRDVMANRSRRTGKSIEEVATAPYQFSAASRPDLAQFYAQQPLELQQLAQQLVAEAQHPDFVPQYPGIEFYVTNALWKNRFAKTTPSWIREMEPAFAVGAHVALKPRRHQ